MYDPKSLKAEEFICHEEIEDTLKYADENKDNMPLIREILDKARLCNAVISNYLLFYTINKTEETVNIARFLYGGQNITKKI